MDTPKFGTAPAWEADPHARIVTHPNRVLVWTSDPRAFFTFVNPQWSAITGIHAASLLGFGWQASIEPLDLVRLTATIAAAAAERAAFRERLRLRRQDGTDLWMVMEGQPRIDDDDRHVGYVGTLLDVTLHDEAELDFNIANERITDLLRNTPLPSLIVDSEGHLLFVNDAFGKLVGRSRTDLACQPFIKALGLPESSYLNHRLFPGGQQSAEFPESFESLIRRADGSNGTINWQAMVMREFSGAAKGVVLIGEDITHEVIVEQRLKLTHSVFESTRQAMVITDEQARIVSANQAFTQLTGYAVDEAIGKNPRILQSGRHDREFYATMWREINENGHWHGDVWDRRRDGSIYPKFLSISAIRDERGAVTHYAGVFYDISERKALEEELDSLAHRDALTGLANRGLLVERLAQAISLARRSGKQVGLLLIDLDRFRTINDSLGHSVGDEVLKIVAKRLQASIRAHDTAARLGGDEFAVLLPEVADAATAKQIGGKILNELAKPMQLGEHQRSLTPSIGGALFPAHGDSAESLIDTAEQAISAAKSAGRGRLEFIPGRSGE
jgi:diguanylate cyclase (GGDEF)-like protein/PAS domain S-box-containing protein